MRLRWIVLTSALVAILITFAGVAWLLVAMTALQAVVVAAMWRRYRSHRSNYQLATMLVGVTIAIVWAAMAVLALKSGDTSLVGALRG